MDRATEGLAPREAVLGGGRAATTGRSGWRRTREVGGRGQRGQSPSSMDKSRDQSPASVPLPPNQAAAPSLPEDGEVVTEASWHLEDPQPLPGIRRESEGLGHPGGGPGTSWWDPRARTSNEPGCGVEGRVPRAAEPTIPMSPSQSPLVPGRRASSGQPLPTRAHGLCPGPALCSVQTPGHPGKTQARKGAPRMSACRGRRHVLGMLWEEAGCGHSSAHLTLPAVPTRRDPRREGRRASL